MTGSPKGAANADSAQVDFLVDLLVDLPVLAQLNPDQQWTAVADLLPHLDHLLPNEAEVRALNARCAWAPHLDAPDWVEAAAAEVNRRRPSVAVKFGGYGGLLGAAGQLHRLNTTPSVPTDTNGAGDSFNAGYLSALLNGAGPQECLATAVAAGTLSIRGRGGTGAIGTPAELCTLVAPLLPTVCTRDGARRASHPQAPVHTPPPMATVPPVATAPPADPLPFVAQESP